MVEYSTEAVVLHKEPIGESDVLVSLYTPAYGKIVARAKSARKITSKLAAALEPANIISARILVHSTYQIVDAVSLNRGTAWRASPESLRALLMFLRAVHDIVPEGETFPYVWESTYSLFEGDPRSLSSLYVRLLQSAGFDTTRARCEGCHVSKPDYFIAREILFVCRDCCRKNVHDTESSIIALHYV